MPVQVDGASRLDHVQGLRGVVVVIIVLFHCDLPLTGGFVAVDAFFVISGYVIAGLLLREKRATGRISFSKFYVRRVRRLLPVLTVMLVVVAALSLVLESPLTGQRTTGRVGAYAAASLANVALYQTDVGYFAARAETITMRHTWSLSVEEQFYLLFPLLVVLALRRGRRLRALVVAMSVVAVLSFASLEAMAYFSTLPGLGRPHSAAYYLPIGRVWEMAAGVWVAVWHLSRPPLSVRTARWVGAVGAVGLLTAVVLYAETESSDPALLLPVGGTALVLVSCRTPGLLSRALSWGPVCWIGDRSYGWYLWHWPLIVLAANAWPDNRWALLAAAMVGLGVSVVTHRHVEQRFRYPDAAASRRRQLRSGVRLAVVCVTAGVVSMGMLAEGAQRSWGNDDVRSMAAQLLYRPPGAPPETCPMPDVLATGDDSACTVVDGSGSPIYLVGDSNAGQFAIGLIEAGRRLGRPVVLLWRAGCSYAEVTVERKDYDVQACDLHNQQVSEWLAQAPDSTVVVANVGEFIHAPDVSMLDQSTGTKARTGEAKARAWQIALTTSLASFQSQGHEVLLLRMLPHPGGMEDGARPGWDPRGCGLLTILWSVDRCAISVSLQSEDQRQRAALAAEQAAAGATGTVVLDLRAAVCPEGVCQTRQHDTWIYRDALHISETRSAELAPELERGLRSLPRG